MSLPHGQRFIFFLLWGLLAPMALAYQRGGMTAPAGECDGGRCPSSSDNYFSPQNQRQTEAYPGEDDPAQPPREPSYDGSPPQRIEDLTPRGRRDGFDAQPAEDEEEYFEEEEDGASRQRQNAAGKRQPESSSAARNRPSRPPARREALSEFQKQVFESTRRVLPIYGHKLFRRVPSTFAPLDHVPVPPDYAVGPGDQLQIRAWGQIELSARPVIDRNGQIYLPKVGVINVAGVRHDQLEEYLKTAVGRLFRNFELNVNLGKLRSIQILVVGAAQRPGSYTVGGFSTLVNALFASGGPAPNGSMRRIQLRRRGQVAAEFDLYDLLLKGDSSKDVPVLAGDILYIPAIGPQIAVTGSVNIPAIYELREDYTVHQAVEMAGGVSAVGDQSRARLESFAGPGKDASPDPDLRLRLLKNGDIVSIPRRPADNEPVVALRGNVALPGSYRWRPGMRVRDLIPSREALLTREYWYWFKNYGNGGNWTPREAAPPKAFSGKPGTEKVRREEKDDHRRDVSKLTSDINWDYATIQRRQPDLSTVIVPFNLGQALDDRHPEANLALEDHDVITIFAQKDLTVPAEKRTKTVRIEGEVNAPGIYTATSGESLRDLVERAGGLTPAAYLFASDFRRQSTRKEQQKQIEQMVDTMDKELRSKAAALPKTNAEERAAAQEQLAAERNVLDQLRRTRATGRVVLEISPTETSAAALPAVALEDGDRLLIPSRPATVGVVGAVYNQSSFLFQDGKTVRAYLRLSGGGTRDADTRRLFIVRADGSVLSKQMHRGGLWNGNFESTRLMPGDSIVMPERLRTGSLIRGIRDWSQVFSQFALGAAALRVVSP